MKARGFLLALCCGGLLACSSPDAAPIGDAPTAASTASAAAPGAGSAANMLPACKVEGLYKPEAFPTPEAAQEQTTKHMRTWTPECRAQAFEAECAVRCSSFPTDMIIAAAAGEEARALRSTRLQRNRAALEKHDALAKRAEELHRHAIRVRGSARGLTDTCMDRMRADFERVEGLRRDLDARLAELPFGAVSMRSWLLNLKSCLDCSEDRQGCDSAVEDRQLHLGLVKDWTEEVRVDERALK